MRTIDFEYGGKTFLSVTADDLLSQGVPETEVSAALAKDRRVSVSRECRHRIYAVASAEAQMNMASSVAVISSKASSARSEDEKATLAGATSMTEWIAAMRAACAELAQDGEADFSADAAWPEAPEDLVTLVARF